MYSSCTGLTSITVPNNVTSIGDYAFYKCSGLKTITIPNSVTSIGGWSFDGADISSVVSLIENPFKIYGQTLYNRTFSQNTFLNATLYVPKGTIEKYKSTEGWKDFANIIEGIPTEVINVKESPVTIQNNGGVLTVQGAQDGTEVEVYSLSGATEGSTISQSGQAIVTTNLQPGSVAIVKVGTKSIKLLMK